ncbi:cysteine hydrolase [Peribacillus simplex]|uniref:cysteine hydrolase family protein n=1 Tax=Peribacillus simplex TaxID=1478 RepID=UPI002E1B8AD8|nr:cysteine hydrolase [Peribacillus simplex]MED4096922.1 cysteine hydrolase [Peribacillus simplex]
MGKKALINIDYTYDFVADGGSLTCGKPGQDIEKELVNITRDFIKHGEYTVFAIDLHEEGDCLHPESNLFPPHNISGTMGRDLYGALKEEYETNKNQKNVHYIDKTRYSAFAGTDLDIRLRERHITDIYLVGVCTDICILHTAIDAYNLGYKIFVYENAVASFNDAGHHWALGHFKGSLGATIL